MQTPVTHQNELEAGQPRHADELADVVVSDVPDRARRGGWLRALRPWLVCLALLVAAEGAARVAFDHTLSLRGERLDHFPTPASLEVFAGQMARDPAYRVVVVGDSVVVGTALLDRQETLTAQLEAELATRLPGEKISVWNFSIAGGRPIDQYCLLQRALAAHPDFVVVPANYYIVAGGNNDEAPLNHPWLARTVPGVDPDIRAMAPPQGLKERFETGVTNAVESNVRLLGMRQSIVAMGLGMQPRYPFSTPNPAVTAVARSAQQAGYVKPRVWRDRGLPLRDWMETYARPVTADNRNARACARLRSALVSGGTPYLTYLTPQNPAVVAISTSAEQYAAGRRVIGGYLAGPSAPHVDLSEAVSDEWFQDHNHLLPRGNALLAGLIADQIAPRIAADLVARRGSSREGVRQ